MLSGYGAESMKSVFSTDARKDSKSKGGTEMKVLLSDKSNEWSVWQCDALLEDSYVVEGETGSGDGASVALLTVPWALIGTRSSGDEFVVITTKEQTQSLLLHAFEGNLDLRDYGDVTFYNPDEEDVAGMREVIDRTFH